MTAPLKPPTAWFTVPEPDGPQPLTITADGQVTGHLALWNSCHTGFAECLTPPRSPDGYANFHVGALETDDGGEVAVGKLVYSAKHAPIDMLAAAASQHYDDNGHVGAYVRAVDGRHGIWLSGAVRSDIDPEGLQMLRANPPSGDWRSIRNRLTLIAALAVPVPGYPVARTQMALAASGELGAMILEGYAEEEVMEPRSKEFIRKRTLIAASLTAAPTTFTAEQRQQMAKSGVAMPDGSFPIRNCTDYMDARRSIGRAPAGKRARVIAHINKRGAALGCKAPD